jgi:hypothetical protein
VRNDGLLFGHVCSGANGNVETIPGGGGCNWPTISRQPPTTAGGIVSVQYMIYFNTSTHAGDIAALVTLSQPIENNSVDVSGPVRR